MIGSNPEDNFNEDEIITDALIVAALREMEEDLLTNEAKMEDRLRMLHWVAHQAMGSIQDLEIEIQDLRQANDYLRDVLWGPDDEQDEESKDDNNE